MHPQLISTILRQQNIAVLDNVDTSHIDAVMFDKNKRIVLHPTNVVKSFDPNAVRLWMHRNALYTIPTQEAVAWVKEKINGRSALEIGAGNNDWYYHLGIPGSDSAVQQLDQEVVAFMDIMKQPRTNPRPDTLRLDAEEAVRRLKPQVVFGSYITRKFIEGQDIEGEAQASIYGVIDENIIHNCEMYIHFGNIKTHGMKTALELPHEEFDAPWLITRGDHRQNIIYVWGC